MPREAAVRGLSSNATQGESWSGAESSVPRGPLAVARRFRAFQHQLLDSRLLHLGCNSDCRSDATRQLSIGSHKAPAQGSSTS
jgi:hypothetical protein